MRIRIRIQLFTSMRIRIQGAKPMRIHTDPDPGQISRHKKLDFVMKNKPVLYVGNMS